ncbi:ATP-binding protein [Azospirillum picis]|uniref:histidine kinase n=1 Tax=Azospirillum picis TaxID=488438 RepID=A0ABU0MTX1_9PROT|nr:ATP-binding protein [Azospirillum picis]MBP2303185.1 signal transduction histidine kinase/CheY-like chemotaxis protein/HPt (histidine-containing phosphotransfer) domain-containing protein [Azospirillum picis]MDQ0536937.1 signal transduction histidine kinase/CheY-like chemotaxis protein/HPt (histidine-containing phosphotransfer) domain-containing protein [Azospirillum picis]
MFRHSLARLVLALQWTAILAVVALTFLLAGREWLAYVAADRIVALTGVDRVLFTASAGIRFELGVAGVAVLTEDDPAAAIAESHRQVDGYYGEAAFSIAETDFEGRDALLASIRDAHGLLAARRPLLDAVAAQPLAGRDMADAEPWLLATYALAERLAEVSVAVTNTVRMLDPAVVELVYVRQSSYLIRERFGRPCSALRPDVQRNQPLDRVRLGEWREGIGAYRARWDALDEQLARPGAPVQLVEDVRRGRAATRAAQDRMDAVIYGLDGSGVPAMAPAEWSHLCTDAYAPVLALGEHALGLAIEHAERRRAEAQRMALLMAVLSLASLLLGGLSIHTVQRRLSAPMRQMQATIDRLSRQEFDEPVPAAGYPDEMGAIAGALEGLRVGALASRGLQRQLDEARRQEVARANEANRAKTAFLATMSHEVRTPLNGILAMGQLLGDSPLSPQQRQWLDGIFQSGSLLLAVLNDVLDYAKIEAGRMELECAVFSPQALLQAIEASVAPQALAKGLEYRSTVAPLPARLLGDPAKLGQVLLNLVGNAVKFTGEGRVVVSARTREDAAPGRARVEFTVSDTGIGIAPEALGTLFDAFTQSDSSITRRFGGTGLGLAISRRIVEAMGGTIAVESAPGQGSRFTVAVEFALAPSAAPAVPVAPAAIEPAMPELSILLAEDNPVNAAAAVGLLERMGHRVTHAADGLAAVRLAGCHDYDAVLTDLAMPGLDGLELARRIRGLPHATRSQVPIIAVTATVSAERMQDCFAAGMTGFVGKPFHRGELRHALAVAIGADEEDALPSAARPLVLRRSSLLAERMADLGPDRAGRIVGLFVETAPELMQEIRAAAASRDAEACGDAAHRLKSAAGLVGLSRLARMAVLVEQAAAELAEEAEAAAETLDRHVASLAGAVPRAIVEVERVWRSILAAQRADGVKR